MPLLSGAFTTLHVQLDEFTTNEAVQPFKVVVNVTLVPVGMPLTTLVVLFTVPAVLLTVPLLVKLILYVNRSAEQVVPVEEIVGIGLIVRLTDVLVMLLQLLIVFLASA